MQDLIHVQGVSWTFCLLMALIEEFKYLEIILAALKIYVLYEGEILYHVEHVYISNLDFEMER
jgi:hypothetical protein